MSEMTPDEFWAILHAVPETKPIVYKAYYNDLGIVCGYTTDDWSGDYVEIDAETFKRYPEARVVDGVFKLVKKRYVVAKLRPGDSGTACDPRDVCVVVDTDQPHLKWTNETNEID